MKNNVYHGEKDCLKGLGGNLALGCNVTSGNVVQVKKKCKFTNGTAKPGGGIYRSYFSNRDVGHRNEVMITDSSFEHNTATIDGSAFYFQIDQGITNGFGKSVSLRMERCNVTHTSVTSTAPVDEVVAISILNFYNFNGSQSSYTLLIPMFRIFAEFTEFFRWLQKFC